jgi:GDPmannose 4,6-dehydratase
MFWEGKNILITGINGFVGAYLAEELINKGANVYGLIRKRADGRKAKNLVDQGISDNVKFVRW